MANRRDLEAYLRNHFRYETMNSWNRSTSYAVNVKLHNLKLDPETLMRAYEFLDVSEAYAGIRRLIEVFARRHDYQWQAGFNGRSGGYLVLYRGGRRDPGWKTRCDRCGRLTWYETEQPCHVSGCEGTLEPLVEPVYESFVWPGKGVDEDEDFSAWSIEDLTGRVRVVRDFDRLAKACVRSFIRFVRTHRVEEREILVPKKIRVAVNTG
jgi:hypothetical protein